MTMRSAGDWIDAATLGDNQTDWFQWVRAIQRDAIRATAEAVKYGDFANSSDITDELLELLMGEPRP